MKRLTVCFCLFIYGCQVEENCPEQFLHGYTTVTSSDGSSTTTEPIFKCYPPTTSI